MRIYKIAIIISALIGFIFQSCEQKAQTNELEKARRITSEQVNDSIVEISYWLDSLKAYCFLICKSDTIDRYEYSKNPAYHNYTHNNKDGSIYKIKQFISTPSGLRLNEIIYYDANRYLNKTKSSFIHCEVINDSIKLENPNPNYFNKLVVIVGDIGEFDKSKWIKADTLITNKPFITISLKYKGRKSVLQAIKTNSNGQDVGGQDFYFDIDNLICRDINKSLICTSISSAAN